MLERDALDHTLRFSLTAALLLAPAASAQGQVWVVDDDPGPGVDFGTLQAAVDAAVDGDLILVRDGIYAPFTLDASGRSLVLTSDPFGLAIVTGTGPTTIHSVDPSREVVVRGIDFVVTPSAGPQHAVVVRDSIGPVWIEDGLLEGGPCPVGGCPPGVPEPAGLYVDQARAIALRTSLRGAGAFQFGARGGTGLSLRNAFVDVLDSLITGGFGATSGIAPGSPPPSGPAGGDGVVVDGGVLFSSRTTIEGGFGGQGSSGSPCSDGGPGGHSLVTRGSDALATLVDVQLLPGMGGAPGPGCAPGAPGLPIDAQGTGEVVQELAGPTRTLEILSPVTGGNPTTLALSGVPGDFVVLFFSLQLAPLHLPALPATLFVPPAAWFPLPPLPETGQKVLPFTTPALFPGLEGATLFAQFGYVAADGSLGLGSGSALSLLAPGHL